jgi:hypothetical protein
MFASDGPVALVSALAMPIVVVLLTRTRLKSLLASWGASRRRHVLSGTILGGVGFFAQGLDWILGHSIPWIKGLGEAMVAVGLVWMFYGHFRDVWDARRR